MDHPTLQCGAKSIRYDFDTKTGQLFMEEGDCCDMSGCIKFFERIDEKVSRIETFSGSAEDTLYVRRRSSGEWTARLAEEMK